MLNNPFHFCRILRIPYQALKLLQICGSTTCPPAVQLLLWRWLGWSRTLLLSACQVLKCKHNSLSKLLDSSYLILTHLMRLLRWLTTGRKRGMRIGQSSTLASKVLRGKEWPLWKKKWELLSFRSNDEDLVAGHVEKVEQLIQVKQWIFRCVSISCFQIVSE